LLALSAAPLLSCGEPGRGAARGAHGPGANAIVVRYDSMAVAEDQEIYIGSPFSFVVVPAEAGGGALREIWVSDFYSNTLIQFDGAGRFRRRVGGPGSGPGEFNGVGQLFLTGTAEAGEVGAVEFRRRELQWFARATGKLRRIAQFGSGSIGISPPVQLGADSTLVFPMLDPLTRTSLGIFDQRTTRWARAGLLPEPYRRSIEKGQGAFANFFRYVYIDKLDTASVLVAFSGVDSLYRFDSRTRTTTALGMIPRRVRRGLEGDCRFAADAPDPRQASKECGSPRERFSPINGAWVLSDGRLAVVHTDQHSQGRPPRVLVTGTSYLTVLDRESNTACVDMRIPGGDDARAVYDLKGDALYILDRRVTDVRSTLWLLTVPIPPMSGCPSGHLVRRG
jgi:hypothetical protein